MFVSTQEQNQRYQSLNLHSTSKFQNEMNHNSEFRTMKSSQYVEYDVDWSDEDRMKMTDKIYNSSNNSFEQLPRKHGELRSIVGSLNTEEEVEMDAPKPMNPEVIFTLNEPCDTVNVENEEIFAFENSVRNRNQSLINIISKVLEGNLLHILINF